MTTAWSKQFIIFIEAYRLAQANLLAAQWDPDSGGAETFGSLRLSPTGEEPATHYATVTPATETMRDGITTALAAQDYAKLYYTENVLADNEAEWSGPKQWEFVGGVYQAWLAALQDMGLQVIQAEGL